MKRNTSKRLAFGIFAVILLSAALCITTYALFYATVTVESNYFKTGIINIDLNGGEPVIEESEYLFEPGMTVEKDFYIQNKSTWAVYYRIYLDNVEGGLADILEITVFDGENILYQGKASDMTRQSAGAADDILLIGERRELKIRFHYPKGSTNLSQNWELKFELCADAVQEKNNPDKEFD